MLHRFSLHGQARGIGMQKVLLFILVSLSGAIFGYPGKAQPVTGGAPTGGTTTGGTATGGTTGGATTGGNTTGGNVNTGGNVGVNVGEERRYIVEFDEFMIIDETGCDLCGSDEVSFVIRTTDYALLSSLYGDLDSTKGFFDVSVSRYGFKRCALPAVDSDSVYDHEWECDQKGKAAPLSFTIAAWEDDDDTWPAFCSEQTTHHPDPRAPDMWLPNAPFCVEDRGELIGKRKVEIKLEDLAELTAAGQSREGMVDLEGGCDFTQINTCGDSAPHYRLWYRVKRVPDATGGVLVDPNP